MGLNPPGLDGGVGLKAELFGLTTVGLNFESLSRSKAVPLGFNTAEALLNVLPAAFFRSLALFATPELNLSAAPPIPSVAAASVSVPVVGECFPLPPID